MPVELIDSKLLDATREAAKRLPRRRKNHNFHARESDACNRLLNAIEPDSYVQPHRHSEPGKDETLVAIRGRVGLILFDHHGNVTARYTLDPNGSCIGVNIAHGTWHTLLALEPGSMLFEAKAGPYTPLTESERAAWSPAEGTPQAAALLAKWQSLFAGDAGCAP